MIARWRHPFIFYKMSATANVIGGTGRRRKRGKRVVHGEALALVNGRPVVLIADDEEAVRTALGRNLSRLGCEVLVAGDGRQALRTAIDARPAVVFLDLNMPVIDGHVLLRELPAKGVEASIVVMSGQANMDDVIDALRMGAVDFLKKPWSTSELASALERGIDAFRAVDETSARRGPEDRRAEGVAAGPGGRAQRLDPVREELLANLRSQEVALPRMARSFSHLHRCARDLDATNGPSTASLEEIVHLLEGEPSLATTVLRLANSRFFPAEEETEYLSAAVARIGSRMVQTVVETLALRDGYPIRAPELRALHERIWRFSVARGLAMRAIAEVTGPEVALDPVRCYLGGLLLDAGAVFLLWTLDESRREPPPGAATVTAATAATAPEILASFHPAFGRAVLARWGMPADLVALARDHHQPAPPVPRSPMWAAALLARALATRLVGFGDPTFPYEPRSELLDRCAYDLGVGETVLRRLSTTLADDARAYWEIYQ
jgi:FixJ family two-component response regulator/HD-like signal output (HDOD) protein